jgi:FkbM family methyltransferase
MLDFFIHLRISPENTDRSEMLFLNQESSSKFEINWRAPIVPDHIQKLDQKDPELIEHIRKYWIIPPSSGRIQLDPGLYRGRKKDDFSEQGQVTVVLDLLKKQRNGFYVECGAADGQRNSNSLYMELFLNWTGVLIEVDPTFFVNLQSKNRRAYLVNACLSPSTKPMLLNFTSAGISGGLSDMIPKGQQALKKMDTIKPIKVQCFPLYSILAALGVSHVDYFSLDIEGAEVEVLKTIPFSDLTFDTISVEKRLIDDLNGTRSKEQEIVDMLSNHGIKLRKRLDMDIILAR